LSLFLSEVKKQPKGVLLLPATPELCEGG